MRKEEKVEILKLGVRVLSNKEQFSFVEENNRYENYEDFELSIYQFIFIIKIVCFVNVLYINLIKYLINVY